MSREAQVRFWEGLGAKFPGATHLRRVLSRAWAALDVTIEEGLHQLQVLSSTEMKVKDGGSCLRIPKPNPACSALLNALDLRLPEALPDGNVRVDTRRKLPERRKPH